MTYKRSAVIGITIALVFSMVGCEKDLGSHDSVFPYYGYYSELFLVENSGRTIQQLTSGKNFIHYADHIPNSTKIFFVITGIAYTDHPYKLTQVICTMDLSNGKIDTLIAANVYQNTSRVYETEYDISRPIAISHDGKKLYYAARMPDVVSERKDIYCIDIETKSLVNLTNTTPGTGIGTFSISFDDQRIVYSEFDIASTNYRLKIMDASGGNKRILLQSNTVDYYDPQILVDNTQVVFGEFNRSTRDAKLMLIHIDSLTQIVKEGFALDVILFYPEVNADNIIVFRGRVNGAFAVYSYNLTTDALYDMGIDYLAQPMITKKGDEWVYFDSPWKLYRLNADGTKRSLFLNYSPGKGTTHVPQFSESEKLLLINKHSITLYPGDTE